MAPSSFPCCDYLENVPSALVISKVHNMLFKVILFSQSRFTIRSRQLPVTLFDPILILGVGMFGHTGISGNSAQFYIVHLLCQITTCYLSRNIITRFRQAPWPMSSLLSCGVGLWPIVCSSAVPSTTPTHGYFVLSPV